MEDKRVIRMSVIVDEELYKEVKSSDIDVAKLLRWALKEEIARIKAGEKPRFKKRKEYDKQGKEYRAGYLAGLKARSRKKAEHQ